jgi:O-acetylserine/cysteine efflux transporter
MHAMRPLDWAAVLAVMVVWGLNFPVVKLGLAVMPPFTFVMVRFLAVAVMLAPFVKWPRRPWRLLGLSVTLGVAHFSLMFSGMQRIDAATASIAVQLQVPFAALLAAWFFKDKLGWRRLAGMAIAFAGVGLIAGEPRFQGGLGPLLLVLAAACVWAFANIQIKALGEEIDIWSLNGWVAIMAAPQLFVVALATEGNPLKTVDWTSLAAWGVLAFQVFLVVIFGYGVWYSMMRRFSVNQVMPFTLLVPVFGVLSSVMLLDEPLTLSMFIGGVATLFGVGVCVLRRPRVIADATKGDSM